MAMLDILIAEDDTALRDLYLRKFGSQKFLIRTAMNGSEALNEIAKQAPDLLLLDINMPVMDGVEVLKRLQNTPRSFKIIILTNRDDDAMRETAKQFAIEGYFVKKDMSLQSLINMAEKLLESTQAA